MKKSFKRYLSLVMVLMVAFVCLFSVSVSAADAVYKSVYFNSTTMEKSISSYTETWKTTVDGDVWSISNANNNKLGWNYIKMGRKKYASVGSISTTFAIDKAITKVVVTVDKVTASKINSLKVYVASDSAFANVLETVSVSAAQGSLTFAIKNPVANAYYKFEADCASGSSNGLIQISKIDYYAVTSEPMITVTGDSFTEVDDVVSLTATLSNISGNVVWGSLDNNIATVDQSGNVTAVSMGTTTITATINDTVGEFEFSVFPTDGSELTVSEALEVCRMTGSVNCAFVYSTIGVIASIDTAYDSGYNNITVTITDGTASIKAYRMAGGEELVVGDKIKVTGTLVNYNEITPEFVAGATYTIVKDDAADAIKSALNDVAAFMSLGFKYTSTVVALDPSVSVVFGEEGYENAVAVETYEKDPVTIAFDKGSNSNNAPKYYTTGAALRCYGGNTITFTSKYALSKIEFTFASEEGTNEITVDSGTYADGVWTGEATSVTFTIGGETGHRRIAALEISYSAEGDLTGYEYSDVDFRIRCGVSLDLLDIEGIDSYGIKVSANGKEVEYPSTAASWGQDDRCVFVTLALGDVLTDMNKSTVEFTVAAYVVVDGITYISEATTTYSIVDLVAQYYNGDNAEAKAIVTPLYELFSEKGLA